MIDLDLAAGQVPMAVDTDAQRKLARILLIELMASQFASPVRWIETQDVILSNQECDKIVEIGPSTTLVGMFQRTVTSAQYKTQESTRVKSRKLWSSERDTKDIYYEHTPAAPEVNPKQVTQTEINSSTVSPPVETRIEPAVVPVANSELATPKPAPIELEDVAVPVRDIVTTILSRALKKAPSEIDETKSIKALAGGRSTLENEIVGDLQAEFGSLPERAEDAPLSEAWQAIQSHHAGTLGKVSTALINLLFTSKFPSGFTTAVVRDRLNSQWGLKQGRQDSCLLLAVTTQPATRMATESDAKTFMDSVVETYASREGITLGPSHPAGDGGSAPSVMLDSEAARALSESQKALSRQLLDLYAAHAGLDLGEDRRALNTLRRDIETKLQAELDFWAEELGSDYTNGIQPRFDARKVRSYDSAWNWARQRLLELFDLATSAQRGDNIAFDRTSVLQSCYAIANAADQTLIPVLNEMLTKLSDTALRSIFMNLEAYCKHTVEFGPLLKGPPRQLAPRTTVAEDGKIEYMEKERDGGVSFADLAIPTSEEDGLVPFLHLREKQADGWRYSRTLTTQLHDALTRLEGEGSSFSGQTVLITGAGIGSIGAAMIELFLHGGARVIVTSSSLSPETARKYQSIYMDHGAKGSQLIVVPFNQASVQDVASLVEYVYSPSGLDCDVDYLIPFAAISETGRKLDSIDSKSELAHRLMLTNVLRLLGTLKTYKEKSHYDTKPAQVILPLSPNHGVFGGDGLYGESKLALETLFDRWHSEGWQDYLSICGAVIGWTRGTGLMNQNDLVAEGIESAGMRTFSQEEMAYALVGLCVQSISELCQEQPLYADLTGRMAEMQSLPEKLRSLRQELTERSEIQAALLAESVFEQECSTAATPRSEPQPTQPEQRAHVRLDFPKPLDYEQDIHHLHADLHGMVDLDRTVVVTGFSELGPLGNARTRWEMEAYGRFSLEGTIEMAWLMGYIRHYAGTIDGAPYSGWVDAETKKPVADVDVKALYEERILSHTGIRLIESEQKPFLHEVILQEDLEPLQVPEALAQQMKSEHGAFAAVRSSATPDLCTVQLLKGARLFIPRAMQSNQPVGGLIPTGWDPRTYGIPEEIVSQVDRVTLFTLVCTVEALLSSGITDPYELYQYMHVSEVGICIGSGMGGVTSLEKMFKGRQTSPEDIPKDILQETFVNTTGAWVNMLLLSASGPLRTPVGACATALESLELGYDTIVTGKARFCLVGGCDDVTNETSQEFANMKATSNPEEELAKGRAPHEMSRPATSTRSGFVESHGAGLQVLTTATLALKMGLPIRGIIAFASTSSDKAGRSVPAPGKGVLTNAKHVASTVPAPLMNIRSRRKRLEFRLRQIAEARDIALQDLDFEVAAVVAQDPTVDVDAYVQARRQQIVEDFTLEQKDTRFRLGNEFWRNNPQIAPLAGALATWGLTIDDLGVASFHGTSTVLNDKNESSVIQQQLRSLGRRPGNLILSVFQKALTGHSKGAAGAWMLNGALQMLDTGLVPGNRNADNIDPALKEFDLVAYLHRPIRVHELKAVSVTSFGFGQKGAQALCVHPRYLFATLPKDEYLAYTARCTRRQRKADMFFYEAMNENSLFRAKTAPPFAPAQETATYLDPTVRFP